jgi:hypothetical protein
MGHNIYAIIGRKPINENNLRKYQLALAYEGDFAIIILERDSMWYWSDKLGISDESQSENIEWACELSFFFAKELGLEKYAIIQTDYLGGIGSQFAALYENGKVLIADTSINNVLKALGVATTGSTDEFDTINLGQYRNSEYYYWDSNNFADKAPNMIAGKIPGNN